MAPPSPHIILEDLLLAFRRKIMEVCKRESFYHELTLSQSEILRFLDGEEKTVKQVAEYLKITPPSASAMIAEMEKKGFIEREENIHDRRSSCIRATPKALKLLSMISRQKQKILHGMLSKLSSKDKQSLERIITVLIKD